MHLISILILIWYGMIDEPQLTDRLPSPLIPYGCYDVGDAYFNPSDNTCYNYDVYPLIYRSPYSLSHLFDIDRVHLTVYQQRRKLPGHYSDAVLVLSIYLCQLQQQRQQQQLQQLQLLLLLRV
jgi:hypothetical protein